MEPIIVEKKNYSQIAITVVLGLVLVAIVGGYIYFGMRQAGQQVMVEEVSEPESTEPFQPLTPEDKMQILVDLAKQAESGTGTRATAEEKEAILKSLTAEADAKNEISFEEKMKILNELSKPQADNETATTTP